ncbi:MAG: gamma-glutamyltransferase family protein [Actinomycetota bacterium]|nr:gamma-glutamyltransferase family protein [Actinomycetota bacterium]
MGAEVLRDGGNALDAAVAMNAMLGVVYPHMCGLGGDAFLLYRSAADGRVACLNGSGPAPRLATREAFRERELPAIPPRGPLPVTVPGTVGAWEEALRRFGSRPLAELLAPAAAVAEEGFAITARFAAAAERAAPDLARDPVLRGLFLDPGGRPLAAGATLRQPALARSLRRLIEHGARDFYEGAIAGELDAGCRAAGGLLRREDLEAYAPRWVTPVRAPYRGLDVVVTPPNSQGVTALLMLNALAVLGAHAHAPGTAAHVEALVRAKRVAFADRDRHVTDPDFLEAPLDRLLTLEHAREALAAPALPAPRSTGGDTVYLCATDADGNACSLIQSIFFAFGSCFVAGESGILLQNRGHFFSLDDAHPNRLEPGKRTLHTLMACMAFEGERLRFVFGTMGADGQAQNNVQVLERLLAGDPPQEAVSAPRVLHGRFHPEDDPDVLSVEERMGPEVIAELAHRGLDPHVLPAYDEHFGHAHAIELREDGSVLGGSDPRSDGAAIVVG